MAHEVRSIEGKLLVPYNSRALVDFNDEGQAVDPCAFDASSVVERRSDPGESLADDELASWIH
jgi:hypothetical protein